MKGSGAGYVPCTYDLDPGGPKGKSIQTRIHDTGKRSSNILRMYFLLSWKVFFSALDNRFIFQNMVPSSACALVSFLLHILNFSAANNLSIWKSITGRMFLQTNPAWNHATLAIGKTRRDQRGVGPADLLKLTEMKGDFLSTYDRGPFLGWFIWHNL